VLESDELIGVLADVSGKGPAASLLSSMLLGCLQLLLRQCRPQFGIPVLGSEQIEELESNPLTRQQPKVALWKHDVAGVWRMSQAISTVSGRSAPALAASCRSDPSSQPFIFQLHSVV